ncbi:Hypothetical predicted protein [Olea europaea subsp. europaea]|uniref:Uncharacterized protein n=1 Tax=Olea europaea subsp. europaea TaxID=158383 RepID=A0A8S0SXL6_OLEEU|nr:Hypothetical predicted protein [Olea europaea subsp. europaea]
MLAIVSSLPSTKPVISHCFNASFSELASSNQASHLTTVDCSSPVSTISSSRGINTTRSDFCTLSKTTTKALSHSKKHTSPSYASAPELMSPPVSPTKFPKPRPIPSSQWTFTRFH